jgi:CRP/FNR family transcriptional regulator, cyclic AMP receptor protein
MDTQTLLRRVPAFSRLTDEQVALLATSVGIQRFERGETIFHQGSTGSILYIIVHGQIRIYRVSPAGQELAVMIFSDGDFFGELALLDGEPRVASAQAMSFTTALTLHRTAFMHTINTCPPIAASILEVMAVRMRENSSRVEQLASVPATQRVVHQLVDLATRQAQRYGTGVIALHIELDLTQDDLASLSGTTRETVNRVLSGLRDQGLIKVERARISILNMPRLRASLEAA